MWSVTQLGAVGDSVEKVERVTLKPGSLGTDQTIDVMARAAMGKYGAGSAKIRNLAIQIIRDAGVKERDKMGEVVAIHRWVMNHLRYVNDPLWYEFVTHPETLAFERNDGDCDDHVVLESALLASVGIPTRFVVYAFKYAPAWQHVAMQARVGNRWIPLDPIVKDQPAGWEAPDFTNRKIYGTNTPNGPTPQHNAVVYVIGLALSVVALWGAAQRALALLERRP